MQLSIIVPTVNEKQNIADLVPLLLEYSSRSSVEIIIADSPKSTDVITDQEYNENVNIITTPEAGRSYQMNFGAKQAKGDILYFLHADTRPPATFIKNIKDSIDNGYDYGFFSYRFDRYPTPLLKINSRGTRHQSIFTGAGDQSLFIKRSVFNELKGFNEDYCIMEDFEFVKRAKKAGYKNKIIKNDAILSARKFETNSWLKVNLINGLIFSMYCLGFSPLKMQKTYKRLLNEQYIKK